MRADSILERELTQRGTLVFGTVGNSMKPLLTEGKTAAVIRACSQEERTNLKRGDVILFRRQNKWILHRIVRPERKGYAVCGDNRWHLEHGVRPEQILGVMVAVVKDGQETPVTNEDYRRYTEMILRTRGRRFLQRGLVRLKKQMRTGR